MHCPSCRLENPPTAKRCDCGHIFGEPVSSSQRGARGESEVGRALARLVWTLAALGSVVGAVELLIEWSAASGAPQQAVIAAAALAWAVIPYCFARAITGVIKGS